MYQKACSLFEEILPTKKHSIQNEIVPPGALKKCKLDDPIMIMQNTNENTESNPITIKNQSSNNHFVECNEGCFHEVILPLNFERAPFLPPEKPFKNYQFKLDPFQIQAIKCIERGESVIVSAHTSAGKTAIAEYAIAIALSRNQRVIYTSPIKALSNQKYRDLNEEFKDVGLMTGDVTLNPSSGCIIMTTEILRSMLYRGSDLTKEISWVIFDEIHYMRDKERGVVWEETIILLPSTVKYVFLSATIENANEFADWIAKIKNQPCNVISTDYRPVPLVHYIFTSKSEELFPVLDQFGTLNEQNLGKAFTILSEESDKTFERKSRINKETSGSEISKIVKVIQEKDIMPCLIFSFSKRQCEAYAISIQAMDFTTLEEKEQISEIFFNAIQTLSEEDQHLPMIQEILNYLKKGIGIHHGGLLPIIKEITEILFQDNKLKVLFTTETFAMGINMPARTVIFTSIEKFDGNEYRNIGSGEYIQMSGRAGRRGIDTQGYSIIMIGKKLDSSSVKELLKGTPDPLNSSFHLKFNMILNLQRINDMDPLYLIENSFAQFQNDKSIPKLENELNQTLKEKSNFKIENFKAIKASIETRDELNKLETQIRMIVNISDNLLPFFVPGRLLKIKTKTTDWGWGILINYEYKRVRVNARIFGKKSDSGNDYHINEGYLLNILLYVDKNLDQFDRLQPGSVVISNGELAVMPIFLENVELVSTIVFRLQHNLKDELFLNKLTKNYIKLMERYYINIPTLDPIKDMQLNDSILDQYILEKNELKQKILDLPPIDHDTKFNFQKYCVLKEKRKNIKQKLIKSKNLKLSEDYKRRQTLLKRLNYIDINNNITNSGKVACEISSMNELMATELIFGGKLNNLTSELLASLFSCLIGSEIQSKNAVPKQEELKNLHHLVLDEAERIGNLMNDCKIEIDVEEFKKSFSFDLMEITYEWCKGKTFLEICNIQKEIHEGTIVRSLKRLDECLKEMSKSMMTIGNIQLNEKFEEASKKIKRGIVFAASLYL